MHPTIQAVFDEHANPTHCGKREVHDIQSPILVLAAKVQQQTAKYRELLMTAELSEHSHELDGRLEALHQKLGAIDKSMPDFIRLGRTIARAFTELEREMTDAQTRISTHGASNG